MRTEQVCVLVRYYMTVVVADDATNQDVLDAAEEQYIIGDFGVLDDHEIDPAHDYPVEGGADA